MSGEMRRKESGNVFGEGSRTTISITILVKKSQNTNKAQIFYHDIGDYLTREEKLDIIQNFGNILNPDVNLSSITPNEAYDWVNQRSNLFETFISMGSKDGKSEKTFFISNYSCGAQTNRDSWVYNFSSIELETNAQKMVDVYNQQLTNYQNSRINNPFLKPENFVINDESKIKWSSSLLPQLQRGVKAGFEKHYFRIAMYRPFCKQYLYFDNLFIHRPYKIPCIFPTPQSKNLMICVPGIGVTKDFSVLMVDTIPDLELIGKTQCFPLYYYEKIENRQRTLFDDHQIEHYRKEAISDFILDKAQTQYHGIQVTKEEIFFYVYALLHSNDYKRMFSTDLKKMMPRIPFVKLYANFKEMVKIGRELGNLHTNYEHIDIYPYIKIYGQESGDFSVTEMHFKKNARGDNKQKIIFNSHITIDNIPLRAYDYIINGKSAVEWIMERYRFIVHKDSQIINDPNLWTKEQNKPRYILDLLLRVISLSIYTLDIIDRIPRINFDDN